MMDKASDVAAEEVASLAAGRAAGYCWEKNPHGRGRCTWPPTPEHTDHRDVYAKKSWSA